MRVRIRIVSPSPERTIQEEIKRRPRVSEFLHDASQIFELDPGPTIQRPWSLAIPFDLEGDLSRLAVVDLDGLDTVPLEPYSRRVTPGRTAAPLRKFVCSERRRGGCGFTLYDEHAAAAACCPSCHGGLEETST